MPPKRDRSPSGKGAAASKEKLFDTLTAVQKNGVARLVATLALQYHSRKEILESSIVSKAVKDFLGADVRIRLETDVLPLANEVLYSKIRMRAVEVRRQGTNTGSIVLQNQLKPALFAEFVLPRIHATNTDRTCTDIPDNGQLMFVLGTIVLYPQCRVELSVLRQQMLESGGKKILLTADESGAENVDKVFESAFDRTLDKLRKLFYIDLKSATEAASSDKFVALGSRALLEFGKVGLLHFVLSSMGITEISDEEIASLIGSDPGMTHGHRNGQEKDDAQQQMNEENEGVVAEFRSLQASASHGVAQFRDR